MRSRRYWYTLLGILLVALPATAEASRHRHRRIASVTLSADRYGSLIAVTFSGRHRHSRLLRSPDPIASYAVADVDNDGHLDIIATSNRSGLLVWHNAGRGKFVIVPLTSTRVTTGPTVGFRHVKRVDDGPVASDDRYDAAMPRAPASFGSDPAAPVQSPPAPFAPRTPTVPRPGRAPPQLSV